MEAHKKIFLMQLEVQQCLTVDSDWRSEP